MLLAIPPTMIILSNLGIRFFITPILVEIFDPPIIQVIGFLISVVIFFSAFISDSSCNPAKDGRHGSVDVNEEAAGVEIITKQNTTKDVKPGDERKNVKQLGLENFADGKKKGKSRPGRVKKAGASCKGSVSSLRAKAKKYGGEKGKMYHWCANMKGGKKK